MIMKITLSQKMKTFRNKKLYSQEWANSVESNLIKHMDVRTVNTVHRQRHSWRFMKTGIIALIIAIAGISTIAQASSPDGLLHGWELNVNERIQSALTIGAENQANFEVDLVNERLEELAEISEHANVNFEAIEAAQERVNAQLEKVQEHIQKLADNGDKTAQEVKGREVEGRLVRLLNAHTRVLHNLEERANEDAQKGLQQALDAIEKAQIRLNEDKNKNDVQDALNEAKNNDQENSSDKSRHNREFDEE
jgi:hypothetical protein